MPKRFDILVGRNIERARQAAGLSRESLSAQLGWLPWELEACEKGLRSPGAMEMASLAYMLKVPLSELLRAEGRARRAAGGDAP
ncbi:MAG: hypothetical protein BGN86_11630 [Caulobacterales bacterium 68-7]|nr:helix-turn-helix transcriptional regulator [Caulobacterales bacterium]OJU12305.1 MAG: hypothetical protein BGN86_11630 [Caulobacterales bacterium 68-7]